jgi:ABC-type branched-subunit amino acid transport system substrate-binding protein
MLVLRRRAARPAPHGSRSAVWGAAGFAALSAVGLVACGSSGGSSGTASGPSPIVLTVNVAQNSVPPNYPDNVAAAKAAARAINAAGGVNGRQIEIRTCNDGNNPNTAVACARKAVTGKAAAVVGAVTEFGSQVTPILAGAGIPYLGANGIVPAEYSCATCYPFDAGSALAFAGMPTALLLNGAKSVTMVRLDLAAAASNAQGAAQAAKASGLTVTSEVKVGATSTDLAPAVQAAEQTGAQAAISILPEGATTALVKAADQAHSKLLLGVVDGQVQDSLGQFTASQAKRVVAVGAYPPVDDVAGHPGLAQYAKEMNAEVAAGDTAAATRDSTNLRAWLSVHIVAQVAKGITGPVTSSSLNTALEGAKNINLYGILPNWTPAARGTIPGFERVSNASVFFLKVANGTFVANAPVQGLDLNAHKPIQ